MEERNIVCFVIKFTISTSANYRNETKRTKSYLKRNRVAALKSMLFQDGQAVSRQISALKR